MRPSRCHRPIKNANAFPGGGASRPSIPDLAYSKHLAHELERVAKPSRRSHEPEESQSRDLLKRDLQKIYQKKMTTKKRHSSERIAPWDEQNDELSVQGSITSLTSIHAKYHDKGSYTKDYIHLAREYKRMEKYRIHPRERETAHQLLCVTCSRCGDIDKVFFPCQHRCMCSNCQYNLTQPKQCPLCHAPISKILNNTEHVFEEYWSWVDEVRRISSFLVHIISFCSVGTFSAADICFDSISQVILCSKQGRNKISNGGS